MKCRECGGVGVVWGTEHLNCRECGGSGKAPLRSFISRVYADGSVESPTIVSGCLQSSFSEVTGLSTIVGKCLDGKTIAMFLAPVNISATPAF